MSPKIDNPGELVRYSVIRAMVDFGRGDGPESKLFIVLFHGDNRVTCLKTTSQVAFYRNSPHLLPGCVRCAANEHPFFPKETIIPADDVFPILYDKIEEVVGVMPADFHDKLVEAINKSERINPKRRAGLLSKLG